MRIDFKNPNLFNISFSSKTLNSIRQVSSNKMSYTKPAVGIKENIPLQELKEAFLNKFLQKDSNIITPIKKMFEYIKKNEQLLFANLMLNNTFFNSEERINKLHGIVMAANTKEKRSFVSKIYKEENLYNNEPILNNIEPILYSSTSKEIIKSRNKVLDKVLSSKTLKNNENFIKDIGNILYRIDDRKSAEKIVKIFDNVLANEELSGDRIFIENLGDALYTLTLSAGALFAVDNVLNNSNTDTRKSRILASIIAAKDSECVDILFKILNNKELYNDNEILRYLPTIMLSTNKKNYQKINDLIKYLRREDNLNSIDKNEYIITEYLSENYNSISQIETFLRVEEKLMKKSQGQAVFTNGDEDIEDFFDDNKERILASLELVGEKNFIHAYSSKIAGLRELCKSCQLIKENLNKDYYEKLLLKINPQSSQKYNNLKQKIYELKQTFSKTKGSNNIEKLENLKKEINTYTKKSRDLLSKKLNYDPDTVINRIKVLASMIDEATEVNKKAEKYIDILEDSNPENDKKWKDFCYREIFNRLDIEFDEALANKLNLIKSKYIGKILLADTGFLEGLKEIFLLIKSSLNKSITEIFNELPKNKITKKEFEKYGINYDSWVNYDENSYIIVRKEHSSKEFVIKKANMNDLSKSLFLGNEASCCTKVGNGSKQKAAPNYIKNKLISAIEILDSRIPIGNTMCYFAKVYDKVSLILDNIELLPNYINDNDIRNGFIEYAKKLCVEVGKPDIPIYIAGHRNLIDLKDYMDDECYLLPIGCTGKDFIYLDFITSFDKIDSRKKDYFYGELTKVN